MDPRFPGRFIASFSSFFFPSFFSCLLFWQLSRRERLICSLLWIQNGSRSCFCAIQRFQRYFSFLCGFSGSLFDKVGKIEGLSCFLRVWNDKDWTLIGFLASSLSFRILVFFEIVCFVALWGSSRYLSLDSCKLSPKKQSFKNLHNSSDKRKRIPFSACFHHSFIIYKTLQYFYFLRPYGNLQLADVIFFSHYNPLEKLRFTVTKFQLSRLEAFTIRNV